MHIMQITGNTMLITGGGSGIGRELAQRFHDLGNEVIVTGRRRAALADTIAGRARMHAAALDVSDTGAIGDFARKLVASYPSLNVLVNNAGVMATEDLSAARDLTGAEAAIVTNLLGPIRLTDAFIDHLKTQANAAIVNVSSGLAFVPLPTAPTYSATKAAIHSYTVSLRERLKGNVEVIELIPPAVQTELTPGQSTRAGYMPLGDFMAEVMELFQRQPTPAEIRVERVKFLRDAEVEGRFEEALSALGAL
jgi:uncharacterized oxidoreductase